jgi:hypothetical protein
LGDGVVECYQITDNKAEYLPKNHIAFYLFKNTKKKKMLTLQQEAGPHDKLVKMKSSGLAFLEI